MAKQKRKKRGRKATQAPEQDDPATMPDPNQPARRRADSRAEATLPRVGDSSQSTSLTVLLTIPLPGLRRAKPAVPATAKDLALPIAPRSSATVISSLRPIHRGSARGVKTCQLMHRHEEMEEHKLRMEILDERIKVRVNDDDRLMRVFHVASERKASKWGDSSPRAGHIPKKKGRGKQSSDWME